MKSRLIIAAILSSFYYEVNAHGFSSNSMLSPLNNGFLKEFKIDKILERDWRYGINEIILRAYLFDYNKVGNKAFIDEPMGGWEEKNANNLTQIKEHTKYLQNRENVEIKSVTRLFNDLFNSNKRYLLKMKVVTYLGLSDKCTYEQIILRANKIYDVDSSIYIYSTILKYVELALEAGYYPRLKYLHSKLDLLYQEKNDLYGLRENKRSMLRLITGPFISDIASIKEILIINDIYILSKKLNDKKAIIDARHMLVSLLMELRYRILQYSERTVLNNKDLQLIEMISLSFLLDEFKKDQNNADAPKRLVQRFSIAQMLLAVLCTFEKDCPTLHAVIKYANNIEKIRIKSKITDFGILHSVVLAREIYKLPANMKAQNQINTLDIKKAFSEYFSSHESLWKYKEDVEYGLLRSISPLLPDFVKNSFLMSISIIENAYYKSKLIKNFTENYPDILDLNYVDSLYQSIVSIFERESRKVIDKEFYDNPAEHEIHRFLYLSNLWLSEIICGIEAGMGSNEQLSKELISKIKTGYGLISYNTLRNAFVSHEYNLNIFYENVKTSEASASKDRIETIKNKIISQADFENKYLTLQKDTALNRIHYENNEKLLERKEKILAIEQSERERKVKEKLLSFMWISIPIFIGIIFLLIILAQLNKKRRLELELTVNNNSINIHFVKNLLGALQARGMKGDNEGLKQVSDRISSFIKLHHTINNYKQKTISLESEFIYLTEYINLHYTVFSNNISQIPKITLKDISEEDLFYAEIPPMFIQPFVENALEHGIKKGGNFFDIAFERKKRNLSVIITNRGEQLSSESLKLYNSIRRIVKDKGNNSLSITLKRVVLYNGDLFEQTINRLKRMFHPWFKHKDHRILWSISNRIDGCIQVNLIFKNILYA